MTRFALDPPSLLEVASGAVGVAPGHSLVAPGRIRSDAMALLHARVREGRLTAQDARALLEELAAVRIRVLNDRVSRATAWRIAQELDWPDTAAAEYLAIAMLQADALITEDHAMAVGAAGRTHLASLSDLARQAG